MAAGMIARCGSDFHSMHSVWYVNQRRGVVRVRSGRNVPRVRVLRDTA